MGSWRYDNCHSVTGLCSRAARLILQSNVKPRPHWRLRKRRLQTIAIITETIARTPLLRFVVDFLYNKTNLQQLDIHLTHSRCQLAIESRANLARGSIASRHLEWVLIIHHNVTWLILMLSGLSNNGELSRRIDNGNIYKHLLRNAMPFLATPAWTKLKLINIQFI